MRAGMTNKSYVQSGVYNVSSWFFLSSELFFFAVLLSAEGFPVYFWVQLIWLRFCLGLAWAKWDGSPMCGSVYPFADFGEYCVFSSFVCFCGQGFVGVLCWSTYFNHIEWLKPCIKGNSYYFLIQPFYKYNFNCAPCLTWTKSHLSRP